MEDPVLEVLRGGLDRLERENRRLKWLGAVVPGGLVALTLMGQAPRKGPKVVEAQEFIVRDAGGIRGKGT